MKKVLFFWGGDFQKLIDNPLDFGTKTETFKDLMTFLFDRGAEVYICRGYNNVLGNNKYIAQWKFTHEGEERFDQVVEPDAVYDRAKWLTFPNIYSRNVLNRFDFKFLCNSKWLSYQEYPDLFPKTVLLRHRGTLADTLNTLPGDEVVLKPLNLYGGEGVIKRRKDDIAKIAYYLGQNQHQEYIAQELLDTSVGIEGITVGIHDIRVVCLSEQVIWCHVRTPSNPDEFRSNTSLGGNLEEIEFDLLPQSMKSIVEKIKKEFKDRYDDPLFSIDMAMTAQGPKIIEFNDQIGFPRYYSKGKAKFVEALGNRLLKFT